MPVTIEDVALSAGVSRTTVSRVLNNRHEISIETVQNVEQAIRTLGYERSATRRGRRPIARPGEKERAHSMALLIPDHRIQAMQTLLTGQLIHGAEAVAHERGYHFLLTRLREDGSLPHSLSPVQVDGIIVRLNEFGCPITLPRIPIVWMFHWADSAERGDVVCPDNEAIGSLAVESLLKRGHERLGLLDIWPDHSEGQLRARGFLNKASQMGIEVSQIRGDRHQVAQTAEALLADKDHPTGVFIPTGHPSFGALCRELEKRGARVGDDIDLLPCDGDRARIEAVNPKLANIDICGDEIGRVAAQTLVWRLENPREHRRFVLITPRLVENAASASTNPEPRFGEFSLPPDSPMSLSA